MATKKELEAKVEDLATRAYHALQANDLELAAKLQAEKVRVESELARL